MARTVMQDKFCEAPVDWFKALVLERVNARDNYNLTRLAADSKINYSTLRKLMDKDSQTWTPAQRSAVCRTLHINESLYRQAVNLSIHL